jgi:hypothetical protein
MPYNNSGNDCPSRPVTRKRSAESAHFDERLKMSRDSRRGEFIKPMWVPHSLELLFFDGPAEN